MFEAGIFSLLLNVMTESHPNSNNEGITVIILNILYITILVIWAGICFLGGFVMCQFGKTELHSQHLVSCMFSLKMDHREVLERSGGRKGSYNSLLSPRALLLICY